MKKIVDFLNSGAGTALVVVLGLVAVIYFSVELLQASREKQMQALERAQENYVSECIEALTSKHNMEYNIAAKECEKSIGTK